MDHQNRAGSKPGSGGVAGYSEANVDRRERLRKLALETIDLAKDPYFMKNHLGSYECKLCLTLHTNEGSYLAHTQGKKHQANLGRRALKDQKDYGDGFPLNGQPMGFKPYVPTVRKVAVKIGKPGYKVTKIRDPDTKQLGMYIQLAYPQINTNSDDGAPTKPYTRFMSSYEQRIEPPSRHFQYLLVAAEPYETIGFKIQSMEIEHDEGRFWTYWDKDAKYFHMQFYFKDVFEQNQ